MAPSSTAGNSWWQRKERNLDNCWHGILCRVKGWTYPCRSMPMTQPNRLWQSRARMFRRWQSEFSAPMTYLIARWQLVVFHRTEGKRSSSCIWWERALS